MDKQQLFLIMVGFGAIQKSLDNKRHVNTIYTIGNAATISTDVLSSDADELSEQAEQFVDWFNQRAPDNIDIPGWLPNPAMEEN